MKFDSREIELAKELKTCGMPWVPEVGHYVWDEFNEIDCESPFHGRLFFILNMSPFERSLGSIESMQSKLVWLPTWKQARTLLDARGVSNEDVQKRLVSTRALAEGRELAVLYEMLLESVIEEQQSVVT